MITDTIFTLNQYISNLQEPTRFFAYMGIYVGLPILCFLLLLLDKKLEDRKLKKYIKERRKQCHIQ